MLALSIQPPFAELIPSSPHGRRLAILKTAEFSKKSGRVGRDLSERGVPGARDVASLDIGRRF
jgi:hypothetical protein